MGLAAGLVRGGGESSAPRGVTRLWCDGPTLMRAVAAAVANLERHVNEVDALNVFPVPDGDTGSNMLATMRAALAEAERLPADRRDLGSVAQALSRGALMGARGNSGVILSQIVRGMTLGADGRRRASGVDLAAGLRHASEVAYGSVLTPVEGTILTVIRDTADAAEAAAGRQPHVEEVLAAAIEAAARSVARTPSLLLVLQDAGVVDSGGQGLYRLLEGTIRLDIAPETAASHAATAASHAATANLSGPPRKPTTGGPGALGYETTYVVEASGRPLELDTLRRELEAVGESVVVAGDGRAARVHVHGARPDLALGVGLAAGRVRHVEVADLDAQVADHAAPGGHGAVSGVAHPRAPAATRREARVALVAVATTEAQARLYDSLGVATIVRAGNGQRASAGEIAAAIGAAAGRDVIVLPDDVDTQPAARLAATHVAGASVRVLEARNVAEGVAAALAFDPSATLARNLERMTGEARALRTFALSIAARDAAVEGSAVRRGQVIAVDAGSRLVGLGEDLASACLAALARVAPEGPELLTVYQGEEVPDASVEELATRVVEALPGLATEVVPAGQPGDRILLAVE